MRTRLLAGAASTALLTLGLTMPAHADTPYDTAPLQAATTWLTSSLQSNLLPSSYGPNYGGSADAAMSLEATGDTTDAKSIADAVAANIDSYISGDAFGDTGSTYAGAVAKAAVMLQATGGDPTDVGPSDDNLITRLEAQVQPSGRIQDTSLYGDYETTLGQAFAARALTTAGSDDTTAAAAGSAATSFLLTQQCSAGWFRLYFDTTGSSDDPVGTDESCDADPTSGPSVDATATAILELEPQVSTNAAVSRAIGRAESWLISVQASNGSFTDGTSSGEANTNSTGLAGEALALAGGHTAAVEDAASWVRMQQLANAGTCTPITSDSVGAIAHDTDAWDTGSSGETTQSDSFWLPTAQALPILQYVPATTADLALTGPTGYVKAGSTATYHVSGAVAGEPVCVTGGTSGVLARTGATTGTGTAVITEHGGTATRTISVTDGTSTASTTTKTLGATTLHVSLNHAKRARKALEHVTVTGLASKESVSIHWHGKVVAHGTATTGGTYKTSFHVGTRTGKSTVTADGQFSNRSGTAHLTVVK